MNKLNLFDSGQGPLAGSREHSNDPRFHEMWRIADQLRTYLLLKRLTENCEDDNKIIVLHKRLGFF